MILFFLVVSDILSILSVDILEIDILDLRRSIDILSNTLLLGKAIDTVTHCLSRLRHTLTPTHMFRYRKRSL